MRQPTEQPKVIVNTSAWCLVFSADSHPCPPPINCSYDNLAGNLYHNLSDITSICLVPGSYMVMTYTPAAIRVTIIWRGSLKVAGTGITD